MLIEPGPALLPEFLHSYRPDIIASSAVENVYIDIKSSESLPSSDYMPDLALEIENHDGWRYQLVMTNPRNRMPGQSNGELLSINEVNSLRESAMDLSSVGRSKPAMLLIWTALESALRHIVSEQSLEPEQTTPKYLIKYLFSLGLISTVDQRTLESALDKRNALAHGYEPERIDKRTIHKLSGLYTRLLKSIGIEAQENRSRNSDA